MPAKTVIEFKNVDFSYGKISVIEKASFKIKKFSNVVLVGPNGGGKTAILKLILGLETPNKGDISVLNHHPFSSHIKTKIGYLPQHLHSDRAFPVTVMDVVLMGCLDKHTFGWYSKQDKQKSLDRLKEMGLENLEKRNFSELSGGEQQRVLIARALVSEPELLLLDEATANIDPVSAQHLHNILKKLSERMTILLVSHDIGLVSDRFDNVLCVNRIVHEHCTSKLTGEDLQSIYDGPVEMVQHVH
ncbi:MAG: metal ABC transporter ATP-binding protein [Verrucomicrobiota bacterium]|nr:metal ABC transporter ATP-binding protein [Verrucomicrobiota bacterium]